MQKTSLIVPPGGFPGFAQQTPATQRLFQSAGRIGGRVTQARRRRKSKAKRAKAAAPKRRRGAGRVKARKGRARLVKGSAAAKRYMASIRKKRRR